LKLQFNLEKFKVWLIAQLKGQALKLALKKLLGTAAAGGFKVWLIKYIVTELYDEIAEPLIKMALNHAGYIYDKNAGKIHISRLKKARADHDQETYDSTSDDIFS